MSRNWLNLLRRKPRRQTSVKRPLPIRLRSSLDTLEQREMPAAFTPGNLITYRIGDGINVLSGSKGNPIFIDEYTTAGVFVQSIPLPTSGAGQIIANGTATSEGQMQLSGNGKYVSIPGYNIAEGANATTVTLNNLNTTTAPRAVAVMDSTGVVINYSSLTDVTGALRSAVTENGSDVYFSSSSVGVRLAKAGDSTSTLIGTTPTNTRNIQIFGGQLYVTTMSGTSVRVGTVGTGVPTTTGQTISQLQALPFNTNAGPYGMYFCDLSVAVPGIDTAYYLDDGASTATFGGLTFTGLVKLTKDGSGNWSQSGNSINITGSGLRGLTGSVSGSSVTLYATLASGNTTVPVSKITTFVDASGFGNSLAGTFTDLVTAPSGAFKTAFRGITFAPNLFQPNATSITSTASNPTSASSVTFTVGFSTPVNTLSTSNLSLTTTGDVTGTINTPTTSDGGLNWTVNVTGITGDGSMRLDLVNTAALNPTPGSVPFTTGTVVNVDHASATENLLDVLPGNVAVYYGKIGAANGTTLDMVGSNYTINDSQGTITLTAAAMAAGWTGNGTNTVTGADTATNGIRIKLAGGVDSFTLNKINDALTVTGGGDVGDIATFPVTINYAGSVSVTEFDTLSTGGGVSMGIDSLTLGATGIGTIGSPLVTKSLSVTAIGGTGGIYVSEADGASFTFTEVGGDVSIGNNAGTLTIGGASTWDTGFVTLTSADGVAVNANLGSTGTTKGNLNILANTDGAGSEGYSQSSTADIQLSSTASLAITVNTTGGGTGDAVLGTGHTDSTGFTTVDSNAGNILWNPAFVIPALSASNSKVLTSGGFAFQTSGAASSIGSASSPLQLNCNKATGLTTATAGTGGVYITRYGIGTSQFSASAQGAGNVQIWAGEGSNNGIEIVGPGLKTGSGTISVRSGDAILVNAPIGGAGFSGSVLMEANLDGGSSQSLLMTSGNAITTTNSTSTAVVLMAYPQGAASFPLGGITIGDITTGSGGGVVINAAALLGNATDTARQGAISRIAGTTIDTGAGTVTMTGKGGWIGKAASPVTVTAAKVVANTTSANTNVATNEEPGNVYVTSTGASSFSATTGDAFSTSTTTFDRIGVINLSTQAGKMTIDGAVTTGYGDISLSGADGVVLLANVGSATTGSITLLAGTGFIDQTAGVIDTEAGTAPTTPPTPTTGTLTLQGNSGAYAFFKSTGNKASLLVTPQNFTAFVDGSFDASGAVQVDGILGGNGEVGTVTVSGTGEVSPGSSPGKFKSGNVVFNSGSSYRVEMNGKNPGIGGHDQLTVNGTVDLGGATLKGALAGGYTPSSGEVHVIIDNDGTSDAVTGTFNGLVEGATVTIGSVNFTISYVGGDGNDVTLKAPGVAAVPPTVTNVQFGDGTAQRSMVTSMVVTFSEAVNFTGGVANAFTLFRSGTAVSIPANPTGNVNLTTNPVNGPASSVTITFSGSLTDFASLKDGFYDFTIDATKVSGAGGNLDGNNDTVPGGNYAVIGDTTNKYFRLYGDGDGNATVNQLDFIPFRNAFNNGPSTTWDFEGNGNVTQTDFTEFRNRFNLTP